MKTKEFYSDYIKVFLEQNAKLNLISKKDEQFLWEKHIFDSLAIENFFEKYGRDFKTMLDFGTGGGFPSIPAALAYPELSVTALDSIRKKINAVKEIKEALNINNLTPVCSRVEAFEGNFDIVATRAVASLDKIVRYAVPKMTYGSYFIAYKSIKANDEINGAQKTLKKLKAEVIDIIEYELPLEENHTRNLVIIKKS